MALVLRVSGLQASNAMPAVPLNLGPDSRPGHVVSTSQQLPLWEASGLICCTTLEMDLIEQPAKSRCYPYQRVCAAVPIHAHSCREVLDSQFRPSKFPKAFMYALIYVTSTLTLPNALFTFLAFPEEATKYGECCLRCPKVVPEGLC